MKHILMFEADLRELTENELKEGVFYAKYYDEYSDTTYYSILENDEEVIKRHVKHCFDSRKNWHDELLEIYQSKKCMIDKRKDLWELGDRSSTDYPNSKGEFIIETALELIDGFNFDNFLRESGKFLYHKIESKSL